MTAERRKTRILLVEDEPHLKETLRKHLAGLGYDVTLASTCEAAMESVRAQPPALVCLDLQLPRDSGYELCEYIRRDLGLKQLPIVIMSDHASPEHRAHAYEAGANAYLTKPFKLPRLTEQLRALLDAPPPESRRGS